MSILKALPLLEGASSYGLFRRQHLYLHQHANGSFWNLGKFYCIVGDAGITTMLEYVKNQQLQQVSLDDYPDPGLLGA
jgi:REP element-mobilizing transposase RayT